MRSWLMHKKLKNASYLCIVSSVTMVAQRKEVGGATYLFLESMFDVVIEMQLKSYDINYKNDVRN
jgi:hypothetical protein